MTEQTTIRNYQDSDENSLRELAADLYRFQFPYAAEFEISHAEISQHYSSLLDIHQNKGVILCAVLADEVQGFVCLQGPIEPGKEKAGSEHHYVFMSDLYVAESLRNQGLGTALLNASDAWAKARGCNKIALKVMAANDGTVRFYERNQYQPRFIVMDKAIV